MLYVFSFDLADDGVFVTNIVEHAINAADAWILMARRAALNGIGFDAAKLVASRAL